MLSSYQNGPFASSKVRAYVKVRPPARSNPDFAWVFGANSGQKVRRSINGKIGRVVERIDDRHARRARCQNGLDLAYVEIARPEVGE